MCLWKCKIRTNKHKGYSNTTFTFLPHDAHITGVAMKDHTFDVVTLLMDFMVKKVIDGKLDISQNGCHR